MSTDELLSPDEREALMEVVSETGCSGVETVGDQESALPYDLAGQDYAISSLLPVLETIHERFAHRLGIGLFDLVRRELTVTAKSVERRAYPDFTRSLGAPCSANIIQLSPLSGPALLVFDVELIFMIVDTFFGGTGRMYKSTSVRDFTTIETRFIQRLLDLCFSCLEEAWQPFVALKCNRIGSENRPQFITALNSNEPLTVCTIQISRDNIAGNVHLALPYSLLEPIRKTLLSSLCQEHPNPSPALTERLHDGLQESQVEVRCALAGFELSLSDLLALRVGDVIPVNIPPTAVLRVEEVPLYSGHYGIAQGWSALKIDQALSAPDDWASRLTPPDFAPFAPAP
ncbi:Flagellar motor switching and energizing component FliM [Candidatus Competibacter denitrificans Run_A_D11]|uniref:Flagellar motor switch protein FliM n=1 Tax=Candidatus Competibacter denitrificans Run_A_D11 TaxID=1400863 RepID=W6MD80_9GAMM|nr:flagellar motor switch protein FliM [Candidatus Competibacter denitrificans]CDI02548.1 Flagellar motor switching and energizing component FliM [Candidatus Competibacter denitrificans Run_A_D11]HRC69536.1 flagellar motor switch protein FliM [Candidatus Competibacter denitrificans]